MLFMELFQCKNMVGFLSLRKCKKNESIKTKKKPTKNKTKNKHKFENEECWKNFFLSKISLLIKIEYLFFQKKKTLFFETKTF